MFRSQAGDVQESGRDAHAQKSGGDAQRPGGNYFQGPGQGEDQGDNVGGDEGGLMGKYVCRPCGMSFRGTYNLRRHVKLVHEARSIPVPCARTWCKMEFNNLAEMVSHKEICLKSLS